MKNNLILTGLLFFLIIGSTSAQQDPKAKKILQELSDVAKSKDGLKASFETKLSNEGQDMSEIRKGRIISSGNKYHLYLDDMEVISDGETVWTLISDAEEVQISSVPDDGDTDDFANPTKITTAWEKGFNYKYEKEETLNGNKVHVINLYPQEPDMQDFHTIKLFVKSSEPSLAKIIIKGKGGSDVTYDIKSFEYNPTVKSNSFKFEASKYPDFDVIDLR